MPQKDYYETLGVARSATADEIKRAYRRLAKQYHPDRNAGNREAERKFKEVQAAYDVLKDPEKKSQYDRFGPAAVGNWRTDPASGQRVYTWSSGGPHINVDDLEDLFSAFGGVGRGGRSPFDDLFGDRAHAGRPRRTAPTPGQDLEHRVSISFDEAVRGTTVEFDLSSRQNGRPQRQTLTVRIPAGVEDGQRIRVKGKGQPSPDGGPPGDLYLAVSVRPHPYLRRLGKDLYLDLPLTITEASLGARIDVPTLDGEVTLTIPPGTGSGAKLRLTGRGIKPARGPAGDLYAVVRIAAVKNATERQVQLLKELAESSLENPRQDWTL